MHKRLEFFVVCFACIHTEVGSIMVWEVERPRTCQVGGAKDGRPEKSAHYHTVQTLMQECIIYKDAADGAV
jgi:hypothetical protein